MMAVAMAVSTNIYRTTSAAYIVRSAPKIKGETFLLAVDLFAYSPFSQLQAGSL